MVRRKRSVENRIEELSSLPTIGDLAKRFDVTLRFLRFYEDQGLLMPIRFGNVRLYDGSQQKRVATIVRARMLGVSVAEIREMLAIGKTTPKASKLETVAKKIELLEKKRDFIDEEIARLKALMSSRLPWSYVSE